jgi:hypothetical protein
LRHKKNQTKVEKYRILREPDARAVLNCGLHLGVHSAKILSLLGSEACRWMNDIDKAIALRPFWEMGELDDEYLRGELHPLIHLMEDIPQPSWLYLSGELLYVKSVLPLMLICIGAGGKFAIVPRRPVGKGIFDGTIKLCNVHQAADIYYTQYLNQDETILLETVRRHL